MVCCAFLPLVAVREMAISRSMSLRWLTRIPPTVMPPKRTDWSLNRVMDLPIQFRPSSPQAKIRILRTVLDGLNGRPLSCS
ncbi:hypothetical protein D3C71_1685780 [compost metagenome]